MIIILLSFQFPPYLWNRFKSNNCQAILSFQEPSLVFYLSGSQKRMGYRSIIIYYLHIQEITKPKQVSHNLLATFYRVPLCTWKCSSHGYRYLKWKKEQDTAHNPICKNRTLTWNIQMKKNKAKGKTKFHKVQNKLGIIVDKIKNEIIKFKLREST